MTVRAPQFDVSVCINIDGKSAGLGVEVTVSDLDNAISGKRFECVVDGGLIAGHTDYGLSGGSSEGVGARVFAAAKVGVETVIPGSLHQRDGCAGGHRRQGNSSQRRIDGSQVWTAGFRQIRPRPFCAREIAYLDLTRRQQRAVEIQSQAV